MELSPYSTPRCNSLMHWVNPLRNALNSCGDSIQPCLSPIETLNQSVRVLFTRTEHLTSAYNACRVFKKISTYAKLL